MATPTSTTSQKRVWTPASAVTQLRLELHHTLWSACVLAPFLCLNCLRVLWFHPMADDHCMGFMEKHLTWRTIKNMVFTLKKQS